MLAAVSDAPLFPTVTESKGLQLRSATAIVLRASPQLPDDDTATPSCPKIVLPSPAIYCITRNHSLDVM